MRILAGWHLKDYRNTKFINQTELTRYKFMVTIASKLQRPVAIKMMIVSAIIVSTAGLIFRTLDNIQAFEIVFFRGLGLIFSILITICILYRGETIKTIRSVGLVGMLGAAFFTGAQIFYIFAFSNTSVANTTFTVAVAPFLTALLAWFVLAEFISRNTIIAMMMAAVGISFIIAGDLSAEGKLGIFFAFMTACCFSCFAVTLRRNKHVEMLPVLLFTGIFSALIGLVMSQWESIPSIKDITLCLIWGGLLQGVGQSLLVLSSRALKAAEVPLIMLLEFTLGPIWVWTIYNEKISYAALIGGGIIFVSIFGLAFAEIRKQKL